MYRNFSEDAMRAVMTAHKLAAEFRLDEIPADVLMLALIRESEEIRKEAYRSGVVQRDLLERIVKLPKAAMIPLPIPFAPRINDLLERLSVLPEISRLNLFETMLGEIPHGRASLARKSGNTNPSKWFTPQTYAVLADAEADARANGDDVIDTHNLAVSAAKHIDWVPKNISDGIAALRPAGQGGVAVQTDRDLVLSEGAANVLCEARLLTRTMLADSITAEHILWAALEVLDRELKSLFVAELHRRSI